MLTLMKGFSGLGGFLILAIGLGMLGVTIYGFINSELMFNEYTLLGILLASDLVIILVALLGIIGIKKSNGLMICVFQIFVMIFFCMFLGIGIGAEVLPKTVFEGNCTNSNNPLIELANEAYRNSTASLCTPLCPCGLTDDAINNGGYDPVEKARLQFLTRAADGPVRFQKCDVAKNSNDTIQNLYGILGSVEEALHCSGWCESNTTVLIYKFSNVNSGKPTSFCYPTMESNLKKYGNIIGIAAFGVASFLLLVCMCNLCICCSPERKKLPLSGRFFYKETGYYRVA